MKQRKLNKRKGFTLVELLVVIAILAVLATVSVVGYTSFTKKAKVSNDKSLVSQLNLALDADETLNGKASTPTDALKATREAGYVVEKLTPTTSKYNIVWNQEKNEFALLDEENKVVFGEISKDLYKNWKFADTYVEEGYSVYLNSGFTGTLPATIKTGLDVGENEGLNVSYTKDTAAKNDVVIRTNGGELTVDADTDTVYHYGSSSKVTITAVAGNSYHENGTVTGNLEVLKGRVELGQTADVNTVLVKSATANDVKVDVVSGAKVGSVAPTTDAAKSDIDASTTIPADSKVTEVVDTTKTEMFAGGLGTEKSPYLVANIEQLRNLDKIGVSKSVYVKQISNIIISGDASSYRNASSDYSVIYKFNGTYDGNNYSITNNVKVSGATTWHSFMYKVYTNTVIKNLNVYLGTTWFNLVSEGKGSSITFENINFYNQNNTIYEVAGNNYGLLISYTYSSKVYASNIKNYANINNNEFASGLFIGAWYLNSEVKFTNCDNYGNWNGSCGFFNGNVAYVKGNNGNYDNLTVTNCHNYGTIVGSRVNLLGTAIDESLEKEVELKNSNNFNGMYKMESTSGLVFKNSNGNIEISNVNGATKYVLTMYYHYTGKNQINGGFVLSSTFENSCATKYKVVKFIDSVSALSSSDSKLVDYKSGEKFHDDANNIDYYYIEASDCAYYVFDNPKTIDGDAMVLNGYPRCTLMVYNNDQLIAYEIVNMNNIATK